ncbi:hypothetical protein QZH41_007040 [Actinostola sp. cb2023]|nr:hypothetical protein QZH41_007040 [Actinostola sp. cb2023]
MPVGIAPSHPEPPTGLTMSEYNSLYDWLENCKLAIYIDNFVKGGFDMISITGLTPEEDIMTWLRLIHLDQYTPQLMDNGFDDMDFVKDITIEDLESIGITKPGHQRKLWLAVSALNSAKDSTMTSIRKTNEKENHSTQVERYLETDLDMVEETKIQQEREVVNTDIDSALSRLPADGASDVGFADEEGTTLVRIPKSGMPLTKQIDDNAVASLHIESLDEARGSTPDLDAILDSLDDETKPFQIPSRGLTFPPDLNTQDVSEVSPPVDTGSNDRTSAEIPCGSSQPREHDKKSIESANNAHACHNSVENKTAGFNSCGKSSDERLRGVSFDSSRKAPPPPPVKPKSIRRPPPKIAPKPSVPQVKAKTTEPDTTEHQGENEKIESKLCTFVLRACNALFLLGE